MASNRVDTERLSGIDTAWYRMESAANHANIGAVLTFDGDLDFEHLRGLVGERLVGRFPRFRQRVVESPGRLARPRWEPDPRFSLDHHLYHGKIPEPGDERALQMLVGELMTDALDLERPPWEIHLLDHADGRSSLLAQIHHCLGDGFALARVLLSMADDSDGLGAAEVAPRRTPGGSHRTTARWLWDELAGYLGRDHGGRDLVCQVGRVIGELAHIVGLSFDRETMLRGEVTGRVRVSWTERYELADLKEIADGLECTLNDILMAGVADAIRRLLSEEGEPVDDFDLRAIVPVNLRAARSIEEMAPVLGNQFGLVFFELPIREAGVAGRLERLQAHIGELKASPEAGVVYGILNVEGWVSGPLERLLNEIFARKASLVVSNVPGPQAELRLAGRRLDDLMFWVPHPGPRIGLGVSLISYAGRVRLGVRSDIGIVQDPERLTEFLEASLADLGRQAGTGPP